MSVALNFVCSDLISIIMGAKERESDFCIQKHRRFIDVVRNFDFAFVTYGQRARLKAIRIPSMKRYFLSCKSFVLSLKTVKCVE